MKKGSKMTLKQKANVSKGHKGIIAGMSGKHHTEESNIKNRLAHLGKSAWNKGKYMPKGFSEKMSKATKNVWANPEYRKRMSEVHKGFLVSEETKRKLRDANKGKKMSPESIRKTVEKRIKNGSYKHSEESKRKIGLAGKGRPSWNKGINFPIESERTEWQIKVGKSSRERLLKQYESGKFPRQENTKPERQIKEELIKRGYVEGEYFIHQYKFMNKFMCDFCFPQQKVIVEVNGDFWHANPKKYPDQSKLHAHQIKDIRKDKAKEAYITTVDSHSWTYLTLWEMDIKENVVQCVDKIEEVLAEKKKI